MRPPENTPQGKVVVAGSTGYLGRCVVRALSETGWSVTALVRDPDRLNEAAAYCDEVFVGQATDPSTLDGLFDGATAAFSSIGIRHFRRRPTFEDVDYRANINLAEAAAAAGVKRYVFVSVFDGERAKMDSPLVAAREKVVDWLKQSPMEEVIFRPTGFFNDMGEILEMARKGKVWVIGSGETHVNPIHGTDLATKIAMAMSTENPEPEIAIGGPEVFTQTQIADLAFRCLNRKTKLGKVGIPSVL